ncbi:hypothetical protein HKBW3S44_01585 [Candidatus Hakubella thermalkaliphila]|uniref:Antitoxin n=1 Tax=Candidatus Hakubella thermalkaliphila TaxID=2754717 RepID=A0A6V8PZI0_9ACTN|nr:type II toxin-antitoxin system Phd/YefM family antitoxin [Candidatus Hakubella thermalkaliphila]GFP29548.1 hypothetical protein HKBW3S34_00468 [Candidatus Hakubella thermalkaliphila]GFP37905.1 hypothetical protein HKBW3S44_01585 [Candidatus Hakubella thermalkaliphila]GFP38546.1 hypothetical protein HKBW3S47_00247 [Candidatus Hakubella thermalkaliphila]
MGSTRVTIAEGKKSFTRLVRQTQEGKEGVVITKRGEPVAAIIPFEEYRRQQKMEAFLELLELRRRLASSGVTARELYEQSRKELEERS